jgi:hypothetical protein
MVSAVVLPLVAITWLAAAKLPGLMAQVGAEAGAEAVASQSVDLLADETRPAHVVPPAAEGVARARAEIAQLSALVDAERAAGRLIPWDVDELYALWATAHPGTAEPLDPFDGGRYGYDRWGGDYRIWSSGPDQKPRTTDDVRYDSRSGAPR